MFPQILQFGDGPISDAAAPQRLAAARERIGQSQTPQNGMSSPAPRRRRSLSGRSGKKPDVADNADS
jgi:hypothetical protein